jgi:hypothetical protein
MSRTIFRQFRPILAVSMVSYLVATTAEAGQVWGILPTANQIVQVDPETGRLLGGFLPPGGTLSPAQQFGGLTFAERGRTLLYQNPLANPTDLFRLNPNTGTLLSTEFMPAAAPESDFRAGLTFHSGAGIGGTDAIYAINDGMPVQRQDGYGNPSLVDHAGVQVAFAGALGGDDNGRHFVAAGNEIQEFHAFYSDLVLTSFPLPPGTSNIVTGLAFDGTSVYLSDATGRLFTIDPASGDVLRSVAVENGGVLIGLAARPIPEPGTTVLAITGGLLVLFTRRLWPSR